VYTEGGQLGTNNWCTCRFRIDNTDHVVPVRILDRVVIKCPVANSNVELIHESQMEYSQIYRVSPMFTRRIHSHSTLVAYLCTNIIRWSAGYLQHHKLCVS
jgi:hypothetical protein